MDLYNYKIKLDRVVDGDTIDVWIDLGFHTWIKERVRLVDIDTPELFGPNATEVGKVAKEFVEQWFADHMFCDYFQLVSQKYDAREKYGRVLGYFIAIKEQPLPEYYYLTPALREAGLEKGG